MAGDTAPCKVVKKLLRVSASRLGHASAALVC